MLLFTINYFFKKHTIKTVIMSELMNVTRGYFLFYESKKVENKK